MCVLLFPWVSEVCVGSDGQDKPVKYTGQCQGRGWRPDKDRKGVGVGEAGGDMPKEVVEVILKSGLQGSSRGDWEEQV